MSEPLSLTTALRLLLPAIAYVVLAPQGNAQDPYALRGSFFPAPTERAEAQSFRAAAAGRDYVVIGSPYESIDGVQYGGMVRVYDSRRGTLLAVLKNPAPGAYDNFGNTVAVSGNIIAVGANLDDYGAIRDAGTVYVYDLGSATPSVPILTANAPTPDFLDSFGSAVAVSTKYLVVAMDGDDVGESGSGPVYVYDLQGATPSVPLITLHSPGGRGVSLALSGSRLIIGKALADNGVGAAYLYDLDSSTPAAPIATFNNPNRAAGDTRQFASRVAISGRSVVIGSYRVGIGAANDNGTAYVYDLESVTPTVPVVTLRNPNTASTNSFSWSVALSGSHICIIDGRNEPGDTCYLYDLGSPNPAVPIASLASLEDGFGQAVAIAGDHLVATAPTGGYLYDLGAASPTTPVARLVGSSRASEGAFGSAVAIAGDLMVVGRPARPTAGPGAAVYVFNLGNATPQTPIATLLKPDAARNDRFGSAVAVSGTRVVVGAPYDDTSASDSGAVYVYDLSTATPAAPFVTLNNPSPTIGDRFGTSVAIAGNLLVVGAVGGYFDASDTGSIYVYDLGSATPTVPVALASNPSPTSGRSFGRSVAISGNRLVVGQWDYKRVGAEGIYGDDFLIGHVYVYRLDGSTLTLVATLDPPSKPDVSVTFGSSVAVSDNFVVAGSQELLWSPGEPVRPARVGVYDLNSATPGVPVLILSNPQPEPKGVGIHNPFPNVVFADLARFGHSVGISGNLIIVGTSQDVTGGGFSPFNQQASADAVGLAYLYDLGSASPAQPVATLHNPSPAVSDLFGTAVAISGDRIVVGASGDDTVNSNEGAAYVFSASLGAPSQPEIVVEEPAGMDLTDGNSVVYFGPVTPSGQSTRTFTIKNTGVADLIGFEITMDGADASSFTLTTALPTVLSGPNGTTTFAVTFTAANPGPKVTTLHLASNDPDESNFAIILTGLGREPNQPPVARPDVTTVPYQTAQEINLLANDSDPDSDRLIIASTETGMHGRTEVLAGGQRVRYTPAPGYTGSDTFNYTIIDGYGGSAVGTVQVIVRMNMPPFAGTDTAMAAYQAATLIDVLANDSDPDGDAVTIGAAQNGAHGTAQVVTITEGGERILYTPAAGYTGNDSFTYTVTDRFGANAEGTVHVTVGPPLPPTVTTNGVTKLTARSARLTGTVNAHESSTTARFEIMQVGGTIAGFVLAEENPLSGATSQPISATLIDLAPRTSYRFRAVAENAGGTRNGVEVNFTTLNSSPTTGPDMATVPYQTATMLEVLANDSDPDGDPLTITSAQNAAHGSVQVVTLTGGAQRIRYTPAPGFSGGDSFTYNITDGYSGNAIGTVEVMVSPYVPIGDISVEQPAGNPLVDGGSRVGFGMVTPGETSARTFTIKNTGNAALTGLALSIDGADAGAFAVTTAPTVTTLASGESSSFTITFSAVARGTKTATLHVASNDPDENPFDIALTSVAQNRTPVANPDQAEVSFEQAKQIDVLANDSDPDEDPLTITGAENGAHGTVQLLAGSGGQRIRYAPAPGYLGDDSFTYTISDGFGGSAVGKVKVTVAPPAPETNALYLTGDPVPLAGDSMSGVPPGATWKSFGVPSIANNGRVAFKAQMTTPNAILSLIHMGSIGGHEFVGSPEYIAVRKGDNAQGADGAVFASFKDPLLNNNGTIVFLATLGGASTATNGGIWKYHDSQGRDAPTLVARKGAQPPGVAGARWKAFTSVALSDGAAGEELIAFTANMVTGANGSAGPGSVTGLNDSGLWIVDANGPTLALREGQMLTTAVGMKKVKSFIALKALPGAPGQGHGATDAGVLARVTFTDATQAVVRLGRAGHGIVALPRGAVVGTSETMTSFGLPTQSSAGDAAFIATLTGDTSANAALVIETQPTVLSQMMRKGDKPLDGAASISAFSTVTNDSTGRTAFVAQLGGDPTTSAIDLAIFMVDANGPKLIARKGSPPPGLPAGAKWAKFPSLALADGPTGPVFIGKLLTPEPGSSNPAHITSRNDTGVWALDSTGVIRLIVRTSDLFDATRRIRTLTLLGSVDGSPMQTRSINSAGDILYRASLSDGSEAIVRVKVP